MADKKISALPAATTPLAGTEELPIVQGGITDKVTVANLTAGRAVAASSIINGLGTLTAPTYTFAGDPNTGMWSPGADILAFSQGGVEQLRLSSSGLQAGIIAASGSITASGTGSIGTNLRLVASAANPNISFSRVGYENWFMGSPNNSGDFYISAGSSSTYRLYFGNTGNVTVSAGNLVMGTAGKGIDFSANTHAAGMTSELLTWYEEGTWTPTITFATNGDLAVTYSTQSGTYTRIGRQVTISFMLITSSFTHTTASGVLKITGLPFNAGNTFQHTSVAGIIQGITKANYSTFGFYANAGSKDLTSAASGSGQGYDNITAANMPTGGTVYIGCTLTYFV